MTRTKTNVGLGQAIKNDKKQLAAKAAAKATAFAAVGVSAAQVKKSVLEQSSLQEFLAQTELAHREFEAERGHTVIVDSGATLVQLRAESQCSMEAQALARRALIPIPRRPAWDTEMSAEALTEAEGKSFVTWRRGLASLEEEQGFIMTPFERNLDFWRQLWRCVERSDLLVQILDARDPEFYRSQDLERYVSEFEGKQHLLLINKADFLSPELRKQWTAHFAAINVEVLFFSALRELHKQDLDVHKQTLEEKRTEKSKAAVGTEETAEGDEDEISDMEGAVSDDDNIPAHGDFDDYPDMADVSKLISEIQSRLGKGEDGRRPCVGFVGYPNVGKSSVINSIFGSKKVSMSRTPGKTKYLQTLELTNLDITLCDCPGLVFPSVVATKGHLVVSAVVPLAEVKDFISPVRIIVEKVGLNTLLEMYTCKEFVKRGIEAHGEKELEPARVLLSALSLRLQHVLWVGVPDETWSARKVLKDFTGGKLLYCELPSSLPRGEKESAVKASSSDNAPFAPVLAVPHDEENFDDLGDFLQEEEEGGGKAVKMTKRKMRMVQKQLQKGMTLHAKEMSVA